MSARGFFVAGFFAGALVVGFWSGVASAIMFFVGLLT